MKTGTRNNRRARGIRLLAIFVLAWAHLVIQPCLAGAPMDMAMGMGTVMDMSNTHCGHCDPVDDADCWSTGDGACTTDIDLAADSRAGWPDDHGPLLLVIDTAPTAAATDGRQQAGPPLDAHPPRAGPPLFLRNCAFLI